MKKIIATGLAVTTVGLSSCSMPWSKESEKTAEPTKYPEIVTPVDQNPPIASSGASAPDANPPTATGWAVDANPPAAPGDASKPAMPQTSSTGSSTWTADDADVQAAVDEIDKLFDGIAGDTGPDKK